MKTLFEIKDTKADIAPLDVDLVGGVVKVVGSTMDIEDCDSDIIDSGAWNKTISERGPVGSKLVCNLIDHHASVAKMYGKPSELYVENNQLISVTPILKTSLGMDLLKMYEAGIINQQSVGFSTIRDEMNQETGVRIIKEAKLYEISAVLWGANSVTPTLDFIKDMDGELAFKTLKGREEKLTKELKNGTYTDETFILLEIELKQLQQAITEFNAKNAASDLLNSMNKHNNLKNGINPDEIKLFGELEKLLYLTQK
jgi:HK97 family phage prohead protease